MRNTWKIYMLALIGFFVGTSEFVIAGILDKVADSANISVSAAGQLITVFSIGYAFGPPLIMMAAAKMDRRKLLIIALAILVVGSIMTAVLSGYLFLILSRIILSVGTGVFVITSMTVAPQLAAPERQAGAIATVMAGFSAALVIGIPAGRIIASVYDWRVIFWGIGVLSLLSILAITRVIPKTEGEAPVSLGEQLALLKSPRISSVLGVTFFVFVGFSAVNTFMTPFLFSVAPISERIMSIVLFALGIGSLIGSKLGGFLGDRSGTSKTLYATMILQILALALVSVIPGSLIVTVPLLMLWSIGAWAFSTVQNFNLLSVAPTASGILLSLNMFFVQIGIAAGAGIGGFGADYSMQSISWIGAASVAIALIITTISSRMKKKA